MSYPPLYLCPHMKTKTPPKKTPPKKKPPAVTSENGRPTINAEAVDELIEQTIANLYALQMVWEEISLDELIEQTIANLYALQLVWEKISLKEELK
jgi:hypothetical protein